MPVNTCKVCGKLFKCHSWNTATCDDCLEAGFKYCTSCGTVKPISEFHFKNGKPYVCKACHSDKCCKSYKNTNYKAKRIERYHTDDDYRAKQIAASVASHNKRMKQDDNYRNACIIANHNRRTEARSNFTAEQWHAACEAFDFKCAYCGAEVKLTMDHVVPVSNGGKTSADNVIPACKSCNPSKGKKDMIEWYTAQPFYNKNRLEAILKYLRKMQEGGDAICRR